MTDSVTFNDSYRVRLTECDAAQRAKPGAIFNYLQDVTHRHMASTDLSPAEFYDAGLIFVLSRVHLEMVRYPKLGETVQAETWVSTVRDASMTREIVFTDERDSRLGDARVRCMFLDLNKQRLASPPAEVMDRLTLNPAQARDVEFPQLDPVDACTNPPTFTVRRSDLDVNDHVNSSTYVDWLLESVPLATFRSFELSEFDIAYRQEVVLGDHVVSAGAPGEDDDEKQHCTHMLLRQEDEEVLTLGRSVWRRRSN